LAYADIRHPLQIDDLNEVSSHVRQVTPKVRRQETWPYGEREADREENQEVRQALAVPSARQLNLSLDPAGPIRRESTLGRRGCCALPVWFRGLSGW
jgi:hypothetical protein